MTPATASTTGLWTDSAAVFCGLGAMENPDSPQGRGLDLSAWDTTCHDDPPAPAPCLLCLDEPCCNDDSGWHHDNDDSGWHRDPWDDDDMKSQHHERTHPPLVVLRLHDPLAPASFHDVTAERRAERRAQIDPLRARSDAHQAAAVRCRAAKKDRLVAAGTRPPRSPSRCVFFLSDPSSSRTISLLDDEQCVIICIVTIVVIVVVVGMC